MTDQMLSMTETASRLRITDRHLERLVKTASGPRVTIVEGERCVQLDDLVNWVSNQAKPTGDVQSTISTREFITDRFLTLSEAAQQAGMSLHVLAGHLKDLGSVVEQYRGSPVIRPDHFGLWLASVEYFSQAKDHDLDPGWGKSPRYSAAPGN